MPQLNPGPWFSIMMFTWLIFLTILPKKVMSHKFSNDPASEDKDMPMTPPWFWRWH
uniref:ATP synthase complex subunit 8 n=2 Tax=Scarus TaxID=59660 RepID=A0A222C4X2_9LABR|nr:ATP synthase F0 subunit 8 [Scarus schlegeli]ASO95920.1 ATP synthase F0 subunit 8 [Scarus psittacus]ACL27233.1 ATP synthase F0 subunit 8 [Scarus schlegeli]ASO95922.1 ATP synthase F0 subunit 8 [Scarus psittacus]ASO95924.1 ATP synthase F0 subunit 8 [Scarus psittacus]ASO95926.1 ATP synthase F0 subunit 8 [Scarus psittacus]